jgi:hypothetical protein
VDRGQTLSLNATVFSSFVGAWWASLFPFVLRPDPKLLKYPVDVLPSAQGLSFFLLVICLPILLFIFVTWTRQVATTGILGASYIVAIGLAFALVCVAVLVYFKEIELQVIAGPLLFLGWLGSSWWISRSA